MTFNNCFVFVYNYLKFDMSFGCCQIYIMTICTCNTKSNNRHLIKIRMSLNIIPMTFSIAVLVGGKLNISNSDFAHSIESLICMVKYIFKFFSFIIPFFQNDHVFIDLLLFIPSHLMHFLLLILNYQ